jgi:S-methylmethionine-dependent homocysteine/selenocysteine methylase
MTRLILLDGGTGRELQRIGAPFRQPEWSALALIAAPPFVSQVHRSYVEAGADVITTNSYAVVPFHIGEARFAEQGEALAERAGRLAREVADAAPRTVRVAGSLPPVGGSYRADLFDAARARPVLERLVRGLAPHVDHWHAETLSATAEAELVREVIDATPGARAKPLWLSFTLQDDGAVAGQPRLRSGEPVANAVAVAVKLGAAALLFNCSQPEVMGDAVEAAGAALRREGASLPIGVYANAFPPQAKEATANDGLDPIRDDLTPAGYLGWVRSWRERGASIVGGCCGIGPEHIAAMREALADT